MDQQWPVVRPLPLSITNHFALELIGLLLDFLDFLQYDMKTLRCCVLVCHAWHDCFGRLLFPHVAIRSHEAYESLRQYTLGKSPTAIHLILTQLLEITDNGHQWPLILGRYSQISGAFAYAP